MAKKKPMKDYVVNLNMNVSLDIHVKAHSIPEAKLKAWTKFWIRRLPRKFFTMYADER